MKVDPFESLQRGDEWWKGRRGQQSRKYYSLTHFKISATFWLTYLHSVSVYLSKDHEYSVFHNLNKRSKSLCVISKEGRLNRMPRSPWSCQKTFILFLASSIKSERERERSRSNTSSIALWKLKIIYFT